MPFFSAPTQRGGVETVNVYRSPLPGSAVCELPFSVTPPTVAPSRQCLWLRCSGFRQCGAKTVGSVVLYAPADAHAPIATSAADRATMVDRRSRTIRILDTAQVEPCRTLFRLEQCDGVSVRVLEPRRLADTGGRRDMVDRLQSREVVVLEDSRHARPAPRRRPRRHSTRTGPACDRPCSRTAARRQAASCRCRSRRADGSGSSRARGSGRPSARRTPGSARDPSSRATAEILPFPITPLLLGRDAPGRKRPDSGSRP